MKYLLLLFLLLPTTLHPMGTWAHKISAFGKKTWPKVVTPCYWTLLGGSLWADTYFALRAYKTREQDVQGIQDTYLTEVAGKELQSIGITQKIPVYKQERLFDDNIEYFAGDDVQVSTDGKCIVVSLDPDSRLANTLFEHQMTGKPVSEHEIPLAELRSSIQHEGGHILHHDIEKGIAAQTVAPLIGHGIYTGLNRCLLSPTVSPLKKGLSKTLFFSAAYITMLGGLYRYKQYQELRADDTIRNDPVLLKASINHHKRHERQACLHVARVFEKDISSKHIAKFPISLIAYGTDHPSAPTRIKRFETRLATLEQLQKTR